jgi:hypothetical protein
MPPTGAHHRITERAGPMPIMTAIIEIILKVGESLFGLRDQLAKARQARKPPVADFLTSVAQTIEEASTSLKQNVYPHGKCQELLLHSQQMEAAIGDLIGKQQAADLGLQLKEVWQIERLYGELQGLPPVERERKLSVLDQAAGLFRATADFVRVSP